MTIHVGLIGGGNISETHARAAGGISGVKIAAVYGTNREKVARLCAEYGATPYSDFERFLAHRPMNFVAIGSPSGLHAEQGIAAARRGLHVLAEKPMDISTAGADALIAAAAEARVKLGVFFQDRFKTDLIKVKESVDAGILGKLILADARVKWFRPASYYGDSRWRGTLRLDGGGALINQAIHTVDLLLWLCGEVSAVQAVRKTAIHKIEAEDTLAATLEFKNGAIGTLQAATSDRETLAHSSPTPHPCGLAALALTLKHNKSQSALALAVTDTLSPECRFSSIVSCCRRYGIEMAPPKAFFIPIQEEAVGSSTVPRLLSRRFSPNGR